MAATRKGQRTEAAFLNAARQTFAENGYFNTKISDIAAAAGRSTGSFYNYYDNKEQLLVALLEEFTTEIVEASALPRAHDPAEGVRSAVTAYWNSYKKYLPEMIGLFQMSMMDDEFQQRWRENRAQGIRQILVGLQAADRSGQQIRLPLDLLASALVCTLESFCWTWLAAGGDLGVEAPDDEAAIDTLSAIWYRTVYGASPTG
ncbi:TetR/AcrR family transcriptional regulator [Nocardioides alcanivorans]|uniref:TetR/AcrR family transcriptional regulator n=1 Tax=Nocardioides alcanivorans TaxID=2897352 RepID=UPI001F449387|nr:TetR/AcrR family transcriptional regulator [Nocardioides alcanivorans]